MSYRVIAALMTILMLLVTSVLTANRSNIHARVFIDTKPQFNQFNAQHLDVVGRNYNYFEIVTNQNELNEWSRSDFEQKLLLMILKNS